LQRITAKVGELGRLFLSVVDSEDDQQDQQKLKRCVVHAITSHLPIDHALKAPALMRGLTAYRFVA
jgi:hypothetical protein